MKKFKMDLVFVLIVSIGPVLWFFDALAISILFRTNFLRQLFFPKSFDLVLCFLLIGFPLLVAFLFRPRAPEQERLEEEKALEVKFAKDLASKLAVESKRVEEAVRKEEQQKARDSMNALQQKFDLQLRQARDEEAARVSESVKLQERKGAQEQISAREAGFAKELEVKLASESKRIEEAVRKEEQQKARDSINALQQKYDAQLKTGADEENKRVSAMIRLEEQKKAQDQAKALETKLLLEFESRMVQERKRIEETVRLEEQTKAEASVRALRQKFDELLRAGQEDEKKRIGDLVRMEEQKKMGEQIRALDDKYAAQVSSKIAQERKNIEEAVRLEEQKKAEESVRALRQRYEEQLRSGKDDQKFEEARRVLEEKYAKELVARVEQERSKIEAALKSEMAKKQQSQSSVQMPGMSKVITGLSQQIVTPLGGVLNNVKLIKIKMLQGGDAKSKEVKDALDLIEDNASLCRNMLTSLSAVSGEVRVLFQPVSLNSVIAKIDTLLGHEMKLQNISIQKVLQDNLPQVSGDPALLMQVIFNIISNAKWAIKSNPMSGAGTITVTTQAAHMAEFVELLISDTGIGISQENIPRIFEPYFTTKPDGLGLGLTVAQSIIKGHKGDIQAESKEDKGTTFKITLPVSA
jgi:signal transduction histidine kinase